MSCDPSMLDEIGVAFIEPRIIFDAAVERVAEAGEYKKVYYYKDLVLELCRKHYSDTVFQKLEAQLANIKEIVELI